MIAREANNNDVEQILNLLTQVNNVHHDGRPDLFKKDVQKYSAEELQQIIEQKSMRIIVAVDEGCILGYAFCLVQDHKNDRNIIPEKTLYVDDICVDEASRGKRVGTFLFENVKQLAKELGCYNVTLNVWSCNPVAQKFYQSLGMKEQKIGMEFIL